MNLVRPLAIVLLSIVAVAQSCTIATANDEPKRIKLYSRISMNPEGVTVVFQLAKPVTRLPLEYPEGNEFRTETWTVTTPGLLYKDNEIRSADGSQFSQVEVSAVALNKTTQALYPCLSKIGAHGRIIYASYFAGLQTEFKTTIEFIAGDGAVVLGLKDGAARLEVEATFFGQQAAHRFVYVGPGEYVRRGTRADYVAAPTMPHWLEAEVERYATRALEFFTKKLAVAIRERPLFLFTFEPVGRSFQGDVTDGPVVGLRYFGSVWEKPDKSASKQTIQFVAHEVAHFWNGGLFRSQNTDRERWLHEGGAEYWSHLAQNALGADPPRDPAVALNACIALLGARKLDNANGQEAYPCGATLQWIADLGMRKRGGDIFALWREVFKRAESTGGFYSAAIFREMVERTSPPVAHAFRIMLDEPGDRRWNQLPPLLAKLGVALQELPPA